MTGPIFTSPFTGNVVQPTDVSYESLPFSTNTQLYWPAVVNPAETVAARIMDCAALASGLALALPDASQGALGSDILLRNLGANSFVVTDATGSASVTVGVGEAKYFYLTNNSSIAGAWGLISFGVGTSVADAAALRGAGLTTINGKLATTQAVSDVSVPPTISDASRAINFVWTSGSGTINLPLTSALTDGWFIGFRNGGTGSLTLQPTSPNLINGTANVVANPGDSGYLVYDSNTGNYITIGLTAPTSVSFTAATYDVDSITDPDFSLVSFAPIIQTYVSQSSTRSAPLHVILPAITQIYILVNNSDIELLFKNEGSTAPYFSLAPSTIATVLSDGANIYPLTVAASGTFYATDGSASIPSFSFNSDPETGMYLEGTSILAFTANAQKIMTLDNTVPSQSVVTVFATLNATLISGGEIV